MLLLSLPAITAYAQAPPRRMHSTQNEWPHEHPCAAPLPTLNEWPHELPCAALRCMLPMPNEWTHTLPCTASQKSICASTPDCNCVGAWSVGMNALSRNRDFDEKLPSNSLFKCLSIYSHLVFQPKVENENDPLECTQDIEILSESGKI
jgi:hypothetical protein